MKTTNRLGRSITIDLYECKSSILNSKYDIQYLLQAAAKRAKTKILNVYTHHFDPQGITCVIAIAESHLVIHTWPEHKFASIDIYTCGDDAMPEKAKDYIVEILQPQRKEIKEQSRGHLIFLDK